MRRASVFLLAVALATGANAATVQGINLEEQVRIDGKSLALNGYGLREATVFKVDVYLAALYLEKKSKNPEDIVGSDHVKMLEMHFLRGVKKEKINDAWADSFEDHCDKKCEATREQLRKIQSLMTDMKKGDLLSFTFYPDRVVPVVKGKKKEPVQSADFSKILLKTWLGKKPPNESLKAGLLGQ